MGRKGRNRGFPSWYKGRLRREAYGGFWYGEREGKLFEREGKLVDRRMNDTLTDKERDDEVQKRIR